MAALRAGTDDVGPADAPPSSAPEVRVFATCLGDRFFADAARDAVRLLRSLGVPVEPLTAVACCGQPAWNAGHVEEARAVARAAVARFGDAPAPVVLPSGSCAAFVRHGLPRLGLEPPPVYELAEYVVDVLGVSSLGDGLRGMRVAYHHGCHALRELRVREQPVRLLEGAGAEVVPWEAADECCGFGGLFSVKLPEVSAAMADRKLETLPRAPGVDVLTSADGGCLMQLGGRLGRRRSGGGRIGAGAPPAGPEVLHLATLLWRARSGTTGGSGERTAG